MKFNIITIMAEKDPTTGFHLKKPESLNVQYWTSRHAER